MGLIFDALLLGYFGFSVFSGYRRGFLLSVSGIVALIISVLIYKIFELEYIYFAIIYILLIIAIGLLAKIIRKLKIPLLSGTDALLGLVFGIFNGLAGVLVISVIMLAITGAANIDALDSSFILKMIEGILPI